MKLTAKQEAFCKAYITEDTASDAYRSAYNAEKMSAKSIHEAASRLLKNSKVVARTKELKKEITKEFIWERSDSLRVLSEIANRKPKGKKEASADKDRIASVKELNSMHGYNAPIKNQLVGADGEPITLKVNINFIDPAKKKK